MWDVLKNVTPCRDGIARHIACLLNAESRLMAVKGGSPGNAQRKSCERGAPGAGGGSPPCLRGPEYRPPRRKDVETMGKSKKIALTCEACGAVFYKTPSYYAINHPKFCSKECRGKAQAEKMEQRRREMEKELEGLRTESESGEKRLPHRLVNIRITAKIPIWPEYQPALGTIYQAERYPTFKAPGYVIESGGKRINIRADECVEI